jgi:hypothetical protein
LRPLKQNTQLTTEIKFNSNQAGELANQLGASVLVQKTYGKQAAGDIRALVDIFISDLSEFKPEDIINAIKKHRLTFDDFPTIASIRSILKPEFKPDYAVYTRLCDKQKRGEQLQYQENEYIKAYEKNAMNGLL